MNRRHFLSGLSSALLASQVPRRARAAAGPTATRLIVFFTPNGTIHRHWRPSASGSSFSFPAGSILEPLAPVKDELVILDGLDFVGASNHEGGMAAMLTGGGGSETPTAGASIDQFVASKIGGGSRFASLELGVHTSAWGGSVQTRMSYKRAGEMVPPEDQPNEVYRRLFGAAAAPAGGTDRLLARRKSVLDVVKGELSALERRLGKDEKAKLDQHLTALREMEGTLVGTTPAAPACEAPAITRPSDARSNESFPAVGGAQIDLLLAALSCGLTRVGSVQWSHTVSPVVMSWLGHGESHHSLSHSDDGNANGVGQFVAAERWFADRFRELVEKLAALPEPGGPGRMLDHTLVVWAKEMGDGRLHDCLSVPFVLAGQAGGALKTGRYLKLDHAPHNRLLVSIANAMGVEVPAFGDPAHGTGPLPGLLG